MKGVLSFSNNINTAASNCFGKVGVTSNVFTPSVIQTNYGWENLVYGNPIVFDNNSFHNETPYCTVLNITGTSGTGKKGGKSGNTASLSQNKFKKGFKIYPNPFSNILNLSSLGGKNIQQVKIVNNLGQEVYSKSLQNSSPTAVISVNEFAKGMYFVFITDETGEVFTSKVVKR